MKWVDLTDALFAKVAGHTFVIHKPEYRGGTISWRCIDGDRKTVAEGTTGRIGVAKINCKVVSQKLLVSKKSVGGTSR